MLKIYCMERGAKSGSSAVYELLAHAYRANRGGGMPIVEKTKNGKPFFAEAPDFHFSLSHARTHVLCAISDRPIGADIESPREIGERAIRFFSSPEELRLFDPLDLWVLKESYIKLHGGTLADIRGLRFSAERGRIIAPDGSVRMELYGIAGCRAAIAVREP